MVWRDAQNGVRIVEALMVIAECHLNRIKCVGVVSVDLQGAMCKVARLTHMSVHGVQTGESRHCPIVATV